MLSDSLYMHSIHKDRTVLTFLHYVTSIHLVLSALFPSDTQMEIVYAKTFPFVVFRIISINGVSDYTGFCRREKNVNFHYTKHCRVKDSVHESNIVLCLFHNVNPFAPEE